MTRTQQNWIVFLLLVVSAAIYRIIPNTPAGFAPQLAMAIFGGSVIADKRIAILLPVLSMFIADLLFHFLHQVGLTVIPGFYPGQVFIYALFVLLTLFGSMLKRRTWINVAVFSVAGSVLFFLGSNFLTWITDTGLGRPMNFEGLIMTYGDALAYYREAGLVHGFALNFLLGDLCWSALLFGLYALLIRPRLQTGARLA